MSDRMPSGEWHLAEKGGGVIYDLGSHLLDLTSYILSEKIVSVCGKSVESMHLNIIDNLAGTFETQSGIIGTVNVGWRSGISYDSLELIGTAGYISLNPLRIRRILWKF